MSSRHKQGKRTGLEGSTVMGQQEGLPEQWVWESSGQKAEGRRIGQKAHESLHLLFEAEPVSVSVVVHSPGGLARSQEP